MRPPGVQQPRLEWIDVPLTARGASRGFTILLLGGLSVPLVAAFVPALGSVWLTVSAVLAFTAAAWNARSAARPAPQGAVNAIGSYLLVLPLVLMSSADPPAVQIAATAVVGVVVGFIVGWLRGRRRP